jgi:bifunctional DNA-binding transcriptional regulator/antitoxin component of YhaV-PrlF toxin-antitoxin module
MDRLKSTCAIATLWIDDKGRITLPKSFLIANNVKVKSEVLLLPVYNNPKAVKLVFTERNKDGVH